MFPDFPCNISCMTSDDQATLRRVASAVTARRAERALSQAALAEAADVDPKTVRSLENGERWPQLAKRAAIAIALGWTGSSLDRIRKGYAPEILELAQPTPTEAAPRPKRYGAWSLDTGILAEMSLAADQLYERAEDAEGFDEESEIEDVVAAVDELAEAARKLIELAQAVAEVGVGGRVHLQILKSQVAASQVQGEALIPANQGKRSDHELAARPGETEDEIRERLGIPYD